MVDFLLATTTLGARLAAPLAHHQWMGWVALAAGLLMPLLLLWLG